MGMTRAPFVEIHKLNPNWGSGTAERAKVILISVDIGPTIRGINLVKEK